MIDSLYWQMRDLDNAGLMAFKYTFIKPKREKELKERVAVTLIDFLKERRFGAPEVGESSIPANKWGKRLEIPAEKSASVEDFKVLLEVAEAKAAKPVRRKRAAPETWSTSKSDGIKLKIKKNK